MSKTKAILSNGEELELEFLDRLMGVMRRHGAVKLTRLSLSIELEPATPQVQMLPLALEPEDKQAFEEEQRKLTERFAQTAMDRDLYGSAGPV